MVNLIRATITGQVACTGGTFDGQGSTALDAGAITIGDSLSCARASPPKARST